MTARSLTRPAWLIGLGLALAVPSPAAAAAERTSEFTVGNWEGGSYHDAGVLTHCMIAAQYEEGVRVGFSITANYELFVSLGSETWALGDGQTYEVGLSVDGRPLGRHSATSRDGWIIDVRLGNNGDAYDRLRKGSVLVVDAEHQDFQFELTDTARALARVKQCVDEALIRPQIRNPFAGPGANPFGDPRAPGQEVEQLPPDMVLSLLEAAGETDVRLFAGAELGFPDVPHVWTVDGVIGMLAEFPAGEYTVDAATAELASSLGSDCTGDYASGSRPTRRVGTWSFKDGFGSCSDAGTVANLFFTTASGGSTILVVTYMSDEFRAERARSALASFGKVLEAIAAAQ